MLLRPRIEGTVGGNVHDRAAVQSVLSPIYGCVLFFFNAAFSDEVWEMEANGVSLQSCLSWSLSLKNDKMSNRHSILKREIVFHVLMWLQSLPGG